MAQISSTQLQKMIILLNSFLFILSDVCVNHYIFGINDNSQLNGPSLTT